MDKYELWACNQFLSSFPVDMSFEDLGDLIVDEDKLEEYNCSEGVEYIGAYEDYEHYTGKELEREISRMIDSLKRTFNCNCGES